MRTRRAGWGRLAWAGLGAWGLVGVLSHCGGKAVVDEGGSTTTGTTTTGTPTGTTTGTPTGTTPTGTTPTGTTTTATTTTGTITTTTSTTTTATDCEIACADLFTCTQQDDLCPGLGPGDEPWFVPECVATCEEMPALVALIDPNDCPSTVQTLAAASYEFAAICYGYDFGD